MIPPRVSLSALAALLLLACGEDIRTVPTDAGPLAGDAGPGDAGPPPTTCTDADGDGYAADCAPFDCADDDAAIYPGAPETCDGVDEDCSGAADEGCACQTGATRPCGATTGACEAGIQTCAGGAWGACEGGVPAVPEVCDGAVDDDCDTLVDEGCACTDGATRACGSSVGACVAGTETCAGGAWGACADAIEPVGEACDGTEDDDCDGVVDEGCACVSGASRGCGSDVGACARGTQACAAGAWGTCEGATGPVAERCDGAMDDDCDGTVDEGCPPTPVVSTPTSFDPRVAVGADGDPHVAYHWARSVPGGGTAEGLAYAHWDGAAWVRDETVPMPLGAQNWAFAIDAADRPVFLQCSRATGGPVVAVTRGASAWEERVIDSRPVTRFCSANPRLIRDAAGRLNAFVDTFEAGGMTQFSHYRQDGAGGWTELTPMFLRDGRYVWGPPDVTLGPGERFHGLTSLATMSGDSPFRRELLYARPVAGGGYTNETIATSVTPTNEVKFIAAATDGRVYVANGQSGDGFRRDATWSALAYGTFWAAGDVPHGGVEMAADGAGGVILVYGQYQADAYTVRRVAPDGTVSTLATLPVLDLTNDYVGQGLAVDGDTLHVVYTALECTGAPCTAGAPRIEYARIVL